MEFGPVKQKRVLLIDDLRNLEADVIARNPIEGIRQLAFNGPWTNLLLDHDMACWAPDGEEYTGYHVLLWLEELVHTGRAYHISNTLTIAERSKLVPDHIEIVSDNTSGVEKMHAAIKSFRKKLFLLQQKNHCKTECGCEKILDEDRFITICDTHKAMRAKHSTWDLACKCDYCTAERKGEL